MFTPKGNRCGFCGHVVNDVANHAAYDELVRRYRELMQ